MAGIRLHGESYKKTRLHRIWVGLRSRCNSPTNPDYPRYGGRGISVSQEWDTYVNFKEWAMKNGYSDELSIDRIDVNGNYEPSNCRWTTTSEQAINRRNNHFITYNGETHTVSEWASILGISEATLHSRLRAGMNEDEALTKPISKPKVLEHNGEKHTVSEWSKITGIPRKILDSRLNDLHWSVEKSLTYPYKPHPHNK